MSNLGLYPPHVNSFEPTPHVNVTAPIGEENFVSIDITGGIWKRGNLDIAIANKSFVGSVTNPYIVANISGVITAQAAAPLASDFTKRLLVKLLYATYTVGTDEYPDNPPCAGLMVLTGWEQHQYGDINDTLPDNVSLYFNASNMEEIKGWSSVASTAMVATDDIVVRPTSWTDVCYRGVSTIVPIITPSITSAIGAWIITPPFTHRHCQHIDFLDDSHNGNSGQAGTGFPITYIRADGDAARNAMSGVIGNAAGRTIIDPAGGFLYTDTFPGIKLSISWAVGSQYLRSVYWGGSAFVERMALDWTYLKLVVGAVEVMCWNNTSTGWFLTWTATNTWTPATFLAKPTGDISFDASTGGMLTLKAKNASIWEFDSLALTAVGATKELSLGTGGASWSNIYFNGSAGLDIAGFSTKGGVTGGTKKKVMDLDPSDYVIVAS